MANLSLKNINKVYPNGFQAVYDFNLEIEDGEFIVFVGSSGCGKSTTLRMVAGLEDITSGQLIIDGRDVSREPAKNRDIAMVFQNYALYGHMTVYQNMAFSLTLRKENPDVIHEKVMHAAKLLGLVNQLNKRPRNLSGGQRQRVAVGRAIVRNPKVFLFDEPLSNLDAKLRGQMRHELRLLHRDLKATMIYVTHDQIEALTLADRIVVMHNGYIQQIGAPIELYENPANLYVAGFIGLPAMNLFEVKITDAGTVSHPAFEFKLNSTEREKLKDYIGKDVIIGVRPEHAVLDKAGDVDFRTHLVENLGQNTVVHGFMAGKKATFKFPGWLKFAPEERIKINFIKEKIHFFDKETTNVIK